MAPSTTEPLPESFQQGGFAVLRVGFAFVRRAEPSPESFQ